MFEVWVYRGYYAEWVNGFFRLGQSHDTLPNWYTMTFTLMKHHGYSLSDIENMMPFERDVYILLIRQWLKEEHIRQKEARANQG